LQKGYETQVGQNGVKLSGGQRLSLARAFLATPRILFFDQGKLAADGAHRDLEEGCSAFAEAYLPWEVEEAYKISVVR
jgi:ABC-type multidrug transport system fused ATPase/permease subunit